MNDPNSVRILFFFAAGLLIMVCGVPSPEGVKRLVRPFAHTVFAVILF